MFRRTALQLCLVIFLLLFFLLSLSAASSPSGLSSNLVTKDLNPHDPQVQDVQNSESAIQDDPWQIGLSVISPGLPLAAKVVLRRGGLGYAM